MKTLTQSTQLAYRAGFVKQAQAHFAKHQWAKQASAKMLKKLKELGPVGAITDPKTLSKLIGGQDFDRDTLKTVLRVGQAMQASKTTAGTEILEKLLVRAMLRNQTGANAGRYVDEPLSFNKGTLQRLEQVDPDAAKGLKQTLHDVNLDDAITEMRNTDPASLMGEFQAAGGMGPNVGQRFPGLGSMGNVATARQLKINELMEAHRVKDFYARGLHGRGGPLSGYHPSPRTAESTTGTPANMAEELAATPAGLDIHPGLAALAGGVGGFGLSELMD